MRLLWPDEADGKPALGNQRSQLVTPIAVYFPGQVDRDRVCHLYPPHSSVNCRSDRTRRTKSGSKRTNPSSCEAQAFRRRINMVGQLPQVATTILRTCRSAPSTVD